MGPLILFWVILSVEMAVKNESADGRHFVKSDIDNTIA